jgi:hypothetical protein
MAIGTQEPKIAKSIVSWITVDGVELQGYGPALPLAQAHAEHLAASTARINSTSDATRRRRQSRLGSAEKILRSEVAFLSTIRA